ncbi:MAG: phosphohistidine phosphatase SixA [Candidatus Binatia bacterium]|nr:MAG: phosphohistidine phosphatase SixA [Candidatus Binatia bacterium]
MLYLVQHGEATTERENPERPLTPRGRAEVEKVADFFARSSLVRPREILHSGKRRAAETAEIFARALSLEGAVRSREGLAPNDDPEPLARELGERPEESSMIVGHLPFLSRLASLLVAGRSEPPVVRFRMGGLVGLGREGAGWVVVALVTPEMVFSEASAG